MGNLAASKLRTQVSDPRLGFVGPEAQVVARFTVPKAQLFFETLNSRLGRVELVAKCHDGTRSFAYRTNATRDSELLVLHSTVTTSSAPSGSADNARHDDPLFTRAVPPGPPMSGKRTR